MATVGVKGLMLLAASFTSEAIWPLNGTVTLHLCDVTAEVYTSSRTAGEGCVMGSRFELKFH